MENIIIKKNAEYIQEMFFNLGINAIVAEEYDERNILSLLKSCKDTQAQHNALDIMEFYNSTGAATSLTKKIRKGLPSLEK